jgi:zinc D-Ala-D-Ala carboxypeptidase
MRYEAASAADYRAKGLPWNWPNFTPEEMASHKGKGPLVIETEFMDRLQKLRLMYGRPMIINSAYRTPEYNDQVSGSGRTGAHTERAVDVRVYGTHAFELVAIAIGLGFTGIGFSQAPKTPHAQRFVHLDDIPAKHPHNPRPMIWSY